jgi:hypothetical protein
MSNRSKRIIGAENEKHLAEARAKKDATIALMEAKAFKEKMVLDAEMVVTNMKSSAQTRLDVA